MLETNVSELKEKKDKVPKSKDRLWLKYLITTVVLGVFVLLIAWWRGAFVISGRKALFVALSDAFFIPGFFATFYGLHIIIYTGDVFKALARLIRKLFQRFRQDSVDRKYRNFHRYTKAVREKKHKFWYLIIVGAMFMAISAAFLFIFSAI